MLRVDVGLLVLPQAMSQITSGPPPLTYCKAIGVEDRVKRFLEQASNELPPRRSSKRKSLEDRSKGSLDQAPNELPPRRASKRKNADEVSKGSQDQTLNEPPPRRISKQRKIKFEVEKIVGVRFRGSKDQNEPPLQRLSRDRRGVMGQSSSFEGSEEQVEYLVQWKGHPNGDTWVPVDDLLCPVLVSHFWERRLIAVQQAQKVTAAFLGSTGSGSKHVMEAIENPAEKMSEIGLDFVNHQCGNMSNFDLVRYKNSKELLERKILENPYTVKRLTENGNSHTTNGRSPSREDETDEDERLLKSAIIEGIDETDGEFSFAARLRSGEYKLLSEEKALSSCPHQTLKFLERQMIIGGGCPCVGACSSDVSQM